MSTSPRRKVIEAIREQITSGRYTAGSRLPTELELADELAVARGKKLYDKRATMAARDSRREVERALKERSRY